VPRHCIYLHIDIFILVLQAQKPIHVLLDACAMFRAAPLSGCCQSDIDFYLDFEVQLCKPGGCGDLDRGRFCTTISISLRLHVPVNQVLKYVLINLATVVSCITEMASVAKGCD